MMWSLFTREPYGHYLNHDVCIIVAFIAMFILFGITFAWLYILNKKINLIINRVNRPIPKRK